jgi:hypothetical protein
MPPKVRYTARAEADVYARKRKRITIRHSSNDRVVGLVEIVSPGNKASAHAVRSFVSKASQFLVTGIHLLILDLFPPGPRDPEGLHPLIWEELTGDARFELPDDTRLTMASYAAGTVQQAFIEPAAVHGRLPEMPVFIGPERYVPLDLEPTYEAAFAAVPERWRAVLRAE